MSQSDIFPFTIHCYDNGHYIEMDNRYRETWLSIKPKDYTWYCYDVTIKSRTEITFTIYGMRDTCYGGIGEKQDQFEVTVDKELTDKSIEKECKRIAREIRQKQIDDEETVRINEIKWTLYNTC